MSAQPSLWRKYFLAMVLVASSLPPGVAQHVQKPLFAPAPNSPIAIAGGAANVALGDINRDRKLDMVVASSRGITTLFGQGNGRFSAPGSPITLSASPSEMLLRDLNNDGHLDLAFVSHDSYNVTLLFGDGNGGFAHAPNSPIVMKKGEHPHTHGLNAGDLNGDGHIDLVTVNSNPDNDISVVFGDGNGGFTPAPGSPFSASPSPYPSALGDLNGDDFLDIVATTTDRSESRLEVNRALTILFGDGNGDFRRRHIPLRTEHPWFVAVSDLNSDGKPDIVATHTERRELTVLIGDGAGDFDEVSNSPFDLGHSAWQIAVFDVNNDGKVDVVAAAGDGLRILLGDGSDDFQPAPGSPFSTGRGTWRLAFGDINGDGRLDVATSNLESATVSVLLAQ